MKRSDVALMCIATVAVFVVTACKSADASYRNGRTSDLIWDNLVDGAKAATQLDTTGGPTGGSEGQSGEGGAKAQWVRVARGAESSRFFSIAEDEEENVYAVGEFGRGRIDLGDGVAVTGVSDFENPLIVKYDSFGKVQWARSAEEMAAGLSFQAVAVDKLGNVYVAGSYKDKFDLGDGVRIDEGGVGGALLVKYDSTGEAKWALTTVRSNYSQFEAVAVGADGSIYAAGSGAFKFFGFSREAPGFVTYFGTVGKLSGAILAKVDPSGRALWAALAGTEKTATDYWALTLDEGGGIYVAGSAGTKGTVNFGNDVVLDRATGPLLVKYKSSGIVEWARIPTDETSSYQGTLSYLQSVALDGSGGVYAAGHLQGEPLLDFGNNVTVQGLIDGANVVLVKYDSKGIAQWAKIIENADIYSPVIVDGSGVYLAAGAWSGHDTGKFLECYDFSGELKEAKVSFRIIPSFVMVRAILRDGRGNTIFAGDGAATLDLGNRVGVPNARDGCFVAKYRD